MTTHALPRSDLDFSLFDTVAAPVFVLEACPDGAPRYVAFNTHARNLSGRPLSDYIGHTASEVDPDVSGKTAFAHHCDVLSSGEMLTYDLELSSGGKARTIRTTLEPVKDAQGMVTHLIGTSRDLTIEREIRHEQALLDKAANEMEDFIAMAAHDLRAPMRQMKMIADLLLDGFNDRGDGKLELIEMIGEVALKSNELIEDVLAHANAMDTVNTSAHFNFGALCRDICDVLDPQDEHRFTYTQVKLFGDRTAMQVGLRNVIENAIKNGQGAQLNIDVTVQRGESGMLNVIISDDSVGFSQDALALLNGRAFQPQDSYGLLGVRRMVQARGGRMAAQNAETGSGGVVFFSMPGEWVALTNSLGDPIKRWSNIGGFERSKSA